MDGYRYLEVERVGPLENEPSDAELVGGLRSGRGGNVVQGLFVARILNGRKE